MGCSCSGLSLCKKRFRIKESLRSLSKKDEIVHVVVRTLAGEVEFAQDLASSTTIPSLLDKICWKNGLHRDMVQLIADGTIIEPRRTIVDWIPEAKHHVARDEGEGPVESATSACPEPTKRTIDLTLIKLPGPPIQAEAMSGRRIEVMSSVPSVGGFCHIDRDYRFKSLGDFAKRPGMRYILTSNEDKRIPATKVMWKLKVNVNVTVYLNFRSASHVELTGAQTWLDQGGWQKCNMKSTVSTGIPNGPYSGPVYFKAVDGPGAVELMGSNCGEGTYFVFVDLGYDE